MNYLFKANYEISKFNFLERLLRNISDDDMEDILFSKEKNEMILKIKKETFNHICFEYEELKNKKVYTIESLQSLYSSIRECREFVFYVYENWDKENYMLKIAKIGYRKDSPFYPFYKLNINGKIIISEYFRIPENIRPTLDKFFADIITDSILKEINTEKHDITLNTRLNLYYYIVKRIKISEEIYEEVYKKNNLR